MFMQNFTKKMGVSIFLLSILTTVFFAGIMPDAETIVSVESYNYPEYYFQHNNGAGAGIIEGADINTSGKWKIVPGLADPNGVSFESVEFPGYFLRHEAFVLYLQQNDGSDTFMADATFYEREGFADPAFSSFESYNFPGRFIRHYNFMLSVDPINTGSSEIEKQDSTFGFKFDAVLLESNNFPGYYIQHNNGTGATIIEDAAIHLSAQWKLVPGLADSNGISFESVEFPGYFLRHEDFVLKLHQNDGSDVFMADATFYEREGFADPAFSSFESYNFPGRFIRHYNYMLRVDSINTGSSEVEKNDATFRKTHRVIPESNLLGTAEITVNVDNELIEMSQDLIGIFFEDINYGADGGLYAELLENRSFEYYSVYDNDMHPLYAWSIVEQEGGSASISVENSDPLNSNNTNYLRLDINNAGTDVGIMNSGFDGVPVVAGENYDFSIYIKRTSSFSENFIIRLESVSGEIYGQSVISHTCPLWKKYERVISSTTTDMNARLVVVTTGTGTVYMDMVSLFPQKTFKGRKNGLRADLAQLIADLKPKVLRFPGGCIVHGDGLSNAYRWKDTVGDVAERKPNWNLWGYHQSYGLGFYEYFLFCEDIGAKPLPVLPVGVSCGFRTYEVVPIGPELEEWVQDTLDLIEFANGPVTSTWGALRAKMGHPKPFNLEYICLGNEEHDTSELRERFPYFVDAIKQKYPKIKIIGTSGLGYGIPLYDFMADLEVHSSDEHYYEDPSWFIQNVDRFDNFDRSKPKIFVGEYGSTNHTLYNAVAEAYFLIGIERNSDIVEMTAYAPLVRNINHHQWDPDLIWFTHDKVFGTPSYYVQKMFSLNQGDVYLDNNVQFTPGELANITGTIGVGTWNTQVEYDDVQIESESTILFSDDFSEINTDWNVIGGSFAVDNGVYTQSSSDEPAWSIVNNTFDTDKITYTLRAKKTGGLEGFLIIFGYEDSNNYYWWNIGGWGNTQHAVERCVNGTKSIVKSTSGSINDNQWYDIRIEINGINVSCYLDNELVHKFTTTLSIAVSSCRDKETGDIILKIANPLNYPVDATFNLSGIATVESIATLELMHGYKRDQNSVANPYKTISNIYDIDVDTFFEYSIPAMSVQVIRINTEQVGPDRPKHRRHHRHKRHKRYKNHKGYH